MGGVRKQEDRKPSKAASSAVSQNESLNGRFKPRDAGSSEPDGLTGRQSKTETKRENQWSKEVVTVKKGRERCPNAGCKCCESHG